MTAITRSRAPSQPHHIDYQYLLNLVLLLISSQSSVLKSNKKWQNYFYRHNFRVDSASRTGILQKTWSPFAEAWLGAEALLGCWLLTGTSSGLLYSQGEAGPGRWSQSIHHRYRTPTPTLSVKTLVTLDIDIPDGGIIGNLSKIKIQK